jgi:hypothetical protein
METGSTNLADLLGGGPVQNPTLPQSTTFAPMVTGGGDPFISPMPSNNNPPMTLKNNDAMFSTIRRSIKGAMGYLAFFLAAMIISLPVPRAMFLQYIPNTYTSGGVVSYYGASILGLIAVAITYVLGTLLSILI